VDGDKGENINILINLIKNQYIVVMSFIASCSSTFLNDNYFKNA
jgi:hypothetical protein